MKKFRIVSAGKAKYTPKTFPSKNESDNMRALAKKMEKKLIQYAKVAKLSCVELTCFGSMKCFIHIICMEEKDAKGWLKAIKQFCTTAQIIKTLHNSKPAFHVSGII